MTQPNSVDLECICKLLYETFHIPVFHLNELGEILFECSSRYALNPLYSSKQELVGHIFDSEDPWEFPVFKTTSSHEKFFSVSLEGKGSVSGSILVGPSMDPESYQHMMNDLAAGTSPAVNKDRMIDYYRSLPILDNLKLINAGILLYYMIYSKKLDTAEVIQKNKLIARKTIPVEHVDLAISENREHIAFHHDPLFEKKLFQNVKEGRKEELTKYSSIAPEKGSFGTMSRRSRLRNQKNVAIVGIALSTRAAIEGGVHPEVAYTLSDLYIQNLEEMNEVKAVDILFKDALYDFAERVQNVKSQKYSKSVTLCQDYIFKHLYEEISLSQLAEAAGMNPCYLSDLFKKETGISISEFIQREKIEEAKKLMIYTNHSLSEIYTMLNFYDQSYFTKVFKKFTGVTPRHFKNSNGAW